MTSILSRKHTSQYKSSSLAEVTTLSQPSVIMPMKRRLKTLDLFSGIGGFALALSKVSRVIAYCEIDKAARDVLVQNMLSDKIDKAHVFEDVRHISKAALAVLRPEMITAGSPCQDFSVLSRSSRGLSGDRSGLVWDVFRILDICPCVRHVVLENSPCVLAKGFERVLHSFLQRGFTVAFGTFTASQSGAPHLRNRFYCLATRSPQALPADLMKTTLRWPAEPFPRLLPRSPETYTEMSVRWKLLGNAVVPVTVVVAVQDLIRALHQVMSGALSTKKSLQDIHVWMPSHKHGEPMVYNSPKARVRQDHKTLVNMGTVKKRLWATVVASTQRPCQKLTERCCKNLPTQLFHDVETKAYLKTQGEKNTVIANKRWIVNPRFLEWMMGYPADYTKPGFV